MFLASLNTELFKYALILGTAPLWMPFVKALLAELNDALATEGGLFGRPPNKKELAFIERDPNRAKSPLVSHDFDPDRLPPGGKAPGARRPAPNPARAGAQSSGARGAAPAKIGFSKPRGVRGFARKDQRGS